MKAVEGYVGLHADFCLPENLRLYSASPISGCTSRKSNAMHGRVCRCAAGQPRRDEPPSAILTVQKKRDSPCSPVHGCPWTCSFLVFIATTQPEVGVLEIGSWTLRLEGRCLEVRRPQLWNPRTPRNLAWQLSVAFYRKSLFVLAQTFLTHLYCGPRTSISKFPFSFLVIPQVTQTGAKYISLHPPNPQKTEVLGVCCSCSCLFFSLSFFPMQDIIAWEESLSLTLEWPLAGKFPSHCFHFQRTATYTSCFWVFTCNFLNPMYSDLLPSATNKATLYSIGMWRHPQYFRNAWGHILHRKIFAPTWIFSNAHPHAHFFSYRPHELMSSSTGLWYFISLWPVSMFGMSPEPIKCQCQTVVRWRWSQLPGIRPFCF